MLTMTDMKMSCAQLQITNKGTPVVQPATVSFPGAYNSKCSSLSCQVLVEILAN